MNKKQKAPKKFIKVIAIIFSSLGLVVLLTTIFNVIATGIERDRCKAPGTMVQVDGKFMHLYVQEPASSTDLKTVVLLSGLGTPSPFIDFKPLVTELADTYRVIVVENFGYGWSDRARSPRTAENIVNETHQALVLSGYEPPYVFMPHSISGLYTLAYCEKYPEEVEAVIGMDISVPEAYEVAGDPGADYFINIARHLGLVRIFTALVPAIGFVPNNEENAYSESDLNTLAMFTNWNSFNETILNEAEHGVPSAQLLMDVKFPESLPVHLLASSEIVQFSRDHSWSMDWLELQQRLLGQNSEHQLTVLEAGHYIHWTDSKAIAEIVDELCS
jgi:pimeloyl-ACP methyl ester carboxylesterase